MRLFIRTILQVATLLLGIQLCGQPHHDNIWLSSDSDDATIIDFSSGEPEVSEFDSDLVMEGASASICDADGDLMFYTNGCRIYNWQHRLMENGEEINPGDVYDDFCPVQEERGYPNTTQSSWIIPRPGHDDQYMLLHMAIDYDMDPNALSIAAINRLYYSIIDMSENNGEGLVTQKNVLIDTSYREPKAILNRHANGVDWWYITPLGEDNDYQIYLIDSSGVNFHHWQRIGLADNGLNRGADQLTFNPAGNQFIRFGIDQGLSIYDFDRTSGMLSNFRYIDFPQAESLPVGAGAAVSPSGQYLYVTKIVEVYQYDLWAEDIEESQLLVAELIDDGTMILPPTIRDMQIGPDCKIYGYTNSGMAHHVIHNPDERGDACGWEQGGLPMGRYVFRDQPMFPNFRLGPLGNEGSPCSGPIVSTAPVNQQQEVVKVFPNPASTTLSYGAANNGVKSVAVYNGRGRLFMENSVPILAGVTGMLDVSRLTSGLYVIKLQLDNGKEAVRKVVIQ